MQSLHCKRLHKTHVCQGCTFNHAGQHCPKQTACHVSHHDHSDVILAILLGWCLLRAPDAPIGLHDLSSVLNASESLANVRFAGQEVSKAKAIAARPS